MVRTHPDPPTSSQVKYRGAIAQLGERLLCKQEVIGSIPIGSTSIQKATQNRCPHDARFCDAFCIGCFSSLTTRKK